jgi:dipeptidyl aminopeptidase/acylaminoacyl peptidase
MSDIVHDEPARLIASSRGRRIRFAAPVKGAYELWRISNNGRRLERLTDGRHYISGWDAGAGREVFVRSTPTELPEIWARHRDGSLHRLTDLNTEATSTIELIEPEERWWRSNGRDVHGWYLPPAPGTAATQKAPLLLQIHGGPHGLYGWSPFWEFQLLAAAGIGVLAANPRGSEGYGEAFNAANRGDWGTGPAADVLAGVDALVDEGVADPERLGVTGGSYGGYLTTWIVGTDQRFKAALAARGVVDMTMLMLTGDISGVDWARLEFGATPWEDPDLYRRLSPITHAPNIRTPLLIQHSEHDLRTTVGQAEMLFSTLRSLRRPVRLMRVPEENHELTRYGTPFRRVENLVQVCDWFDHYLVKGLNRLPPLPKVRFGL